MKKLMEELSDIFDTQRIKRKCLDFNIPDTKIIQDDYHKTIDIKPHYQGKAERIIENFMVMTNVAFATYYSWLPIIYRIHEYPDETLVKSTLDELRASGFEFPKINKIDEYTINAILNKTLSYEQSEIIREKILMSMKKARYDTVNLGHFALQFYQYCHITSPIRRISDFITNTVVDEMDNKDISAEKVNYIQGELQQISDNASLAEKIDDEMTREANEMCMAEYMENHLGEEFEVFVTKVFPHGLLVRTSNYIIGKIRLEDLTDDKYYYDPNKQAIIGRNTKTKYQLGSKIHVISKEASKANRSIFFEINKQKVLKITK